MERVKKICNTCGSELKESAKFCGHCGSEVKAEQTVATQNEVKVEQAATPQKEVENERTDFISKGTTIGKGVQNNNNTIIVILCVIAVIIAAIIVIVFISKIKDRDTNVSVSNNLSVEMDEEGKNSEDLQETENIVEVEDEPHELLVGVPVEYMSLRATPGLGEDVIAQLSAGTYLKWYGESQIVDEKEYYKVKVRESGQEGYVAARFCVNVEFEPSLEELTIVETETTLYTYEMMIQDIQTLCNTYPNCLTDRIIGYSVDNREIHEIILGNPNAQNHIMMQAGIHGREYMTSQLIMKMLEYYAYYYDTAEFDRIAYKDLFDKTALHVVPMTNPDGVTISQLGVQALNDSSLADIVYECYLRDKETLAYEEDSNGDMNWVDYYKDSNYNKATSGNTREITFEEYQTIWKANGRGVDLNNNFDAGWEGIQLKENPAYGSYKGYYPVSEPESAALVELAYQHEYQCFISYHSRGQLIYYDVAGNLPENSQASLNFANLMDNWIKYEPVNTNKGYNVNLGGFGDWVQLVLNKPSITIESGKRPCPLLIDEFPSMWNRHRESWAMLSEQFYE